jgi:hypothetical protein
MQEKDWINSTTQQVIKEVIARTESKNLCKLIYDTYKIDYISYEGENRFKGTPIPKGYRAVYWENDGTGKDCLTLERENNEG